MGNYTLTREIKIEDNYDVFVAGGGPAGFAAAVSAARLGCRVLLVEATGCLGGMATSGFVSAFDPMSDGVRNLTGGVIKEVVEEMYKRGFLAPGVTPDYWNKSYHKWTPFFPEGLKRVLDDFAIEADVELRFFTRVIDADVSGNHVNGVVISNVEGYSFIKAKRYIDCTGDAVLADMAGVPCREAGRDTEKIMPPTLVSLYAGIDWANQDQTPHDDRYITIEKAYADGVFTQCDRHLPGMSRTGETTGFLNAGHIYGTNALKCKDLTEAMVFGRKLAFEYREFYQNYFKGYEKAEMVCTAPLLGVRESRRIVGEYELTFEDYITRRHFTDQIGVFNKHVDIHEYDASKEEFERFLNSSHNERLGVGEYFGLPYGIIVPRGSENLWVAGRCASSDVKVQGSIRVMPAAAVMGQAAGTAAVQSIKTGQTAAGLDTAALVKTLRANGASLPQD